MVATRAEDAHCPIVYVNQVGGQDELIFDGASFVVDEDGRARRSRPAAPGGRAGRRPRHPTAVPHAAARPARRATSAPAARRRPLVAGAGPPRRAGSPRRGRAAAGPGGRGVRRARARHARLRREERLHRCRVRPVGRRRLVARGRHRVDALGPEHVHAVSMPSRYSSDHSRSDADALAEALGIDLRTIPIEPAHAAFLEMLAPSFDGLAEDLTEENLQPRIRGTLLMALSNKMRGWLVAHDRQQERARRGVLHPVRRHGRRLRRHQGRAQAARLRAVPPCEPPGGPRGHPSSRCSPSRRRRSCDPTSGTTSRCRPTRCSIRCSRPTWRTTSPAPSSSQAGFDAALVERVTRLVDLSEYKRRQNPPGPRLTPKAFGKDRRMPITNGYRG